MIRIDKHQFISEQMSILSVPYEYGEWTQDVQYPYFVGEISEEPPETEDGAETSIMILNGFHRGKFIDLEQIKTKIKQHFHSIHGLRAETNSGAIAVFYGGAFFVPTGEAELKRIQINLTIKEWKGDL